MPAQAILAAITLVTAILPSHGVGRPAPSPFRRIRFCTQNITKCVGRPASRQKLDSVIGSIAPTFRRDGGQWDLHSYRPGGDSTVAKALLLYADESDPAPPVFTDDGAANGSVLMLVHVDNDYASGGLSRGWQLLAIDRGKGVAKVDSAKGMKGKKALIPAVLYSIPITDTSANARFDSSRTILSLEYAMLTRADSTLSPTDGCLPSRPCFVKGTALLSASDIRSLSQPQIQLNGAAQARRRRLAVLASIDLVWSPCEPNGCCCGGTDCHP